MIRYLLILLLTLASTPAPRLSLEASTSRSDFLPGERFTIAAHLFNDGAAPVAGQITITAPVGFVALGPQATAGAIAPGHALGLSASYQVAANAPKGLSSFVVSAGEQAVLVVVRVGPVVAAAPPAARRVYLPVVR